MPLTVIVRNVGIDSTVIVRPSSYERVARVTATGVVPIWVGSDDVAPGRGVQIVPGDDAYVHELAEELYAAAYSATGAEVTIEERIPT
jgi:hypothetical protein